MAFLNWLFIYTLTTDVPTMIECSALLIVVVYLKNFRLSPGIKRTTASLERVRDFQEGRVYPGG